MTGGLTSGPRFPKECPVNKQISARDVAARLGTDDEPFILDVRNPDEVATWVIPGRREHPAR